MSGLKPESPARLIPTTPQSSLISTPISRRMLFQGTMSAAALAALAACSSGSSSSATASAGTAASGNVTFGSNQSDAVPKAAYAEIIKSYQAQSKVTVAINTVDHNSFQENINNYLQGSPDDVFSWFAGQAPAVYRR